LTLDAKRETPPLVTVSLVTYNGMRWLPGCLNSVRAQDLGDWELLVFDNASTDGSVEWLRDLAFSDPRISLIESSANRGFAAAHNRQILAARGAYVLLLNQDVELDPGFLASATAAFEGRFRIAAVQPRLRRLDGPANRTNILDSTGLVMHRDRRVVSRRQGEREAAQDLVPGPVWGADGPAPVFRRAALRDARLPTRGGGWEILDEGFFMYKEDVDLAWRLRLLGWKAWYAPDALAWHARRVGQPPARTILDIARTNWITPAWIKAISWRNQRLMQIKNDSLRENVRDLPWIALREALSLGFVLAADPARLRALPPLVSALPAARWKRAYIQQAARRRRHG